MKRNKLDCFVMAALALTGLTVASSAQETSLRILSPASGVVARPGQVVTITVSASSAVQKLVLIGQHPLGMARPTSMARQEWWHTGKAKDIRFSFC